jgi:hypothetical protein
MNPTPICPNCGCTTAVRVEMPLNHAYEAEVICRDCGYHLKWVQKNPWAQPCFYLKRKDDP